VGWSPNWVHSAHRPFTGLLYLPRVIVRMENLVEWMAGETEVLGENPDATLSTTNPTCPDPGLNPGRRGGKPATNRFSYGEAMRKSLVTLAKIAWILLFGSPWKTVVCMQRLYLDRATRKQNGTINAGHKLTISILNIMCVAMWEWIWSNNL
jgi:hypothetical protein